MTRPRNPRPASTSTSDVPPRADEGLVGKIRGLKKLRKAGPKRGDSRRATVAEIRRRVGGGTSPAPRAPRDVDHGSIYGDDDESEN
jgi:hypothetical protein